VQETVQIDKKLTDKEKYWMNRKAGLRGQGPKLPKFGKSLMEADDPIGSEYIFDGKNTARRIPKPVGKKAIKNNSKRAKKEQ
jgi:hypothetical protein